MKIHPAAELFPMMSEPELEALAADIKAHGQRDPIRVFRGQLLDGRNRFEGCRRAGVRPKFEAWVGDDPESFVISANLHRRHLNESQRALAAARFKTLIEERAAERSSANLKRGTAKPEAANLPGRGDTRDQAAEKLNVSPRTVDAAARVLKQAAPEVLAAVERGEVAVSDAARIAERPAAEQRRAVKAVVAGDAKTLTEAARAGAKRTEAAKLRAAPIPMPGGPFGVIVADPPWRYDLREDDESHRGKTDYGTMSIEEICALPVATIAKPDSVLWLWCTNAFLVQDDAPIQRVLRAWGFAGVTLLTWDKERFGVGNRLRNSTEHCVLAVRGAPITEGGSTSTLLREIRRQHSRKPESFWPLVERVCPDSARVELFSREPRNGWQVWGNQTEKFAGEASR